MPAFAFSGTPRSPSNPVPKSWELLESIAGGGIPLDVLCVEGALLRGPNGSGRFHMLSGTGKPMIEWVRRLAERADYLVAVGSCAAFGGITTGGNNPTDACGLQYEGSQSGGLLGSGFVAGSGLPVINVAGCPTHPNWVIETLLLLRAGGLWSGRPRRLPAPAFLHRPTGTPRLPAQ